MGVVLESSINPQRSIWEELETWSKGFPDWQRLLLSGAIRHGKIPEPTLKEAYGLFLADHGLCKAPDPMPEIPVSVTGRQRENDARARLGRIHSPSGINQLPNTSEVTFTEGLTVIYGGNGVGKSGFARVLSNACFSRQQHPIYPDVFDPNAPPVPSATIELVDDDNNVIPLPFDGVTEHPELKRGFVVFDSDVAQRHLKDSNPLGFVPTGFDVFAEMARGYATLQSMLVSDIERRQRENAFGKAFIGPETPASKMASGLSRHTDIDALRALASFGDSERARVDELTGQADQLRVNSPDAEINRLSTARPLIVKLQKHLDTARAALSDDQLAADRRLSNLVMEAATEVARQGSDQFSNERLKRIGSSDWNEMISAAVRLGVEQHLHYPDEGDICFLCQQPLGEAARELFKRYAFFLAGEAREKLNKANSRVLARKAELNALQLDTAPEGSLVHDFLARSHPSVLSAISEATDSLVRLRDSVLGALEGKADHPDAIARPDFHEVFDEIVEQIDSDLTRLGQSAVPASLKAVDDERVALRHREVLAQNLDDMVSFVAGARWIAMAEDARGDLNSRHLTDKENELFAVVIAESYRNGLASECEALDCHVPIQFKTQGKKGQTVRSLFIGDRPPGDVLSEGEQRAVALADFLTEVGLNDDNVGIILDDPVTSLDHDRKERIAARLVAEANRRQVIVFTHDLVFFAKLADAAEKADTSVTTHWMQRSADNKPGAVSLDDAPTTTPQYRKTTFAEDTLAQAKVAAGSAQEKLVRQGATQLRRTVEEIVPQYLFKEVVRRWTDRVMVTALKKISWDAALADEIVEVYEACSAIMEGHSHTEAGAEAPPTLATLEGLITTTKGIIARAKKDRT